LGSPALLPQAILLQTLLEKMAVEKSVVLLNFRSMGTELPKGAFFFIGTVYTESFFYA
jgi:hypothetical protein